MITYNMQITEVKTTSMAGEDSVVVHVGWAYHGEENGKKGSFGGSSDFTYTEGAPFTPFNQLTEEQVAGWVIDSWSEERLAQIEASIEAQIAQQSPTLPWAPPPSPPPAPEEVPPATPEQPT